MNIKNLIIFPMYDEAVETIKKFPELLNNTNKNRLLICGIGRENAAIRLTKFLLTEGVPENVYLMGTCGSFKHDTGTILSFKASNVYSAESAFRESLKEEKILRGMSSDCWLGIPNTRINSSDSVYSSDVFVESDTGCEFLQKADGIDMESSAIVTTLKVIAPEVKFLGIRYVTDKIGDGIPAFAVNLPKGSDMLAKMLKKYIII